MPVSIEILTLAVSGAALLISLLAFLNARIARLQALRTEVRRDLDTTRSEAGRLIDRANTLTEETMQVAYELGAAEGGAFRPDEREAFDLRDEARRPLAELERIDTDLGRRSRKRLEAIRKDLARVRRSILEIGTKIDVKTAALDRLLERPHPPGDAPGRKAVFRSAGQEAHAGSKDA
jgi:chromosome segregation ATPase